MTQPLIQHGPEASVSKFGSMEAVPPFSEFLHIEVLASYIVLGTEGLDEGLVSD